MAAASGGETENPASADVSAQPATIVDDAVGILEILARYGQRVSRARADPLVPGALVVKVAAMHCLAIPTFRRLESLGRAGPLGRPVAPKPRAKADPARV